MALRSAAVADLLDELKRRLDTTSWDEKEKLYIAQIQSIRAQLDTEIAARQTLQAQLNEARAKLAGVGVQLNQKPVVTSSQVQQSTSIKLPSAPSGGGVSPRSKSPAEALKPLTEPKVTQILDKVSELGKEMKGGLEKMSRTIESKTQTLQMGNITSAGSALDKLTGLFTSSGGNYASLSGNGFGAAADSPGGLLGGADDDFDKLESPPARNGRVPQQFPTNGVGHQPAKPTPAATMDFFSGGSQAAAGRPPLQPAHQPAAPKAAAAAPPQADLFDFFSSAPAPATPVAPGKQYNSGGAAGAHSAYSSHGSGGSGGPHGLTVATAAKPAADIDFIASLDFGGQPAAAPTRRNPSPEGDPGLLSPGGENSGLLGPGADKKAKTKLGSLLGGNDDEWS